MNVVDPIHFHAGIRPEEPALLFPRGRISWRQLDQALWATALHFHNRGLVARDRVGLTIQHRILHLLSTLGLARIGVAHVALPPSDPPKVRRRITEKLRLKTIIVDSEKFTVSGIPTILFDRPPKLPKVKKIPEISSDESNNTWIFLQSSGTTGAPKFAELTHAAAMERSKRFSLLFNCGIKDVFWPISRLDFVVAKQRALYALQAGAAVCLPIGIPIRFDILPFLRSSGVTLACGTPSHLYQLLSVGEKTNTIPTLRAFEVRSATVSEKLRKAFKERFCPNLFIVYGTNEGDALAIAPPELQLKVPNTVGKATESIDLEVVDNNGNPVGSDVIGEVRVCGPGIVTKYFENTEATQKSFRGGWFYPGDLASFSSDRALILHGRKDDMVIFDGMNIYPAEIENALLDHPAVKEAAAYSIKHERFQDVPVAAVIAQSEVSEEELIRHCVERIGIKYPRKIRFLKDFPRNSMGKILKRELPTYEETPQT